MAVQTKAPACHVKQPPPPSKPYCVGITPALAKQRPQLGSESFFSGLPKATLDTHGPRPQTLLGSRQACRGLSVACPKPASSLRPRAPPANVPAGRSLAQKAFSMGGVRDPRAPPSNPPRQPAGLPRPLCGLSEACPFSSPTGPARKRSCRPQLGPESFFYGLPKATLETHGPRPQTPLGSRQACLSVPAGRSLAQKASPTGHRRRR